MPRAPPRERTYVHPRPAQRPPVDVVEDETTTITFPAGSDGDLKSLPPTKKVEEEGKIDALDQVPLDDKTATAWRLEIGTLLGRHVLGLDGEYTRRASASIIPLAYSYSFFTYNRRFTEVDR